VLMMIVFTIVFTRFQRIDTGGAPYVLFSYLGVLPWTFFSNSLSGGGQSIVSNMSLVNKVSCPREVFPLGTIAVAAIDTLIAAAVLLVLFAVTGVAPKPETLWAPVLLLVLLVYTVGLTLIVSSVLVYLRDLRHVLPLLLQLGLFLTPVAYGMNVIVHTRSKLIVYSFLNPVAPVIDGFRRTVLYGLPPDWELLGAGATGALLAFVGGYIVFKRLEVGIADIA
jgi:ABC-type polysaccharide/polyol phosphate export permease